MDSLPQFPAATWPAIAAVFLLAGVVKGVSGMGLPTLAMALLSLSWPAASSAALMLLPALLTNIAQCVGPHTGALARRLAPLWFGMIVGTLGCPWTGLGGPTAQVSLGAVLVVYAAFGLWRPRLPDPGRHAAWLGAAAGVLGGLLNASTGVFVMPMVPYLQALRLERDAMVQALGLSFTVASLSLAGRLGLGGAIPGAGDLPAVAVALAAAFIGMAAGARGRRLLAPPAFQRVLMAVFGALGLLMLGRAL